MSVDANDNNGFTSSVNLLNDACDSDLIENEFQNRLLPLTSSSSSITTKEATMFPTSSSSSSLSSSTSSSPTAVDRAPIYLIRCDHETCSDPALVPDGRITALPVGSREAMLAWNVHQSPRNILLVKKWRDPHVRDVTVNIGNWLMHSYPYLTVYVYEDPEDPYDLEMNAHSVWPDNFPRLRLQAPTVCTGGEHGQKGSNEKGKTVNHDNSSTVDNYDTKRNVIGPDGIDLVVCVGGDGTVLHLSSLFPTAHPPVIAVAFGSLGFLTTHSISSAKRLLARIFGGNMPPSSIIKSDSASPSASAANVTASIELFPPVPVPSDPTFSSSSAFLSFNFPTMKRIPSLTHTNPSTFEPIPVSVSLRMRLTVEIRHGITASQRTERGTFLHPPDTCHIVLNELLLERGPSPFMASLNTYVDGAFLTTVNADGLIIATQSGSTAYSLSAGGPIVQPAAASIVFTPICPHTLSFRPLIFADSTELIIQVPSNARCSAWASFDGRHSTELKRGDCVVVRSSVWPVPILCRKSATVDWLSALNAKLLWNARSTQQKPLTYTSRSHSTMLNNPAENTNSGSSSLSRDPSGNKLNELKLERGESNVSDHSYGYSNQGDWFDGNDSEDSEENITLNYFARRASVSHG